MRGDIVFTSEKNIGTHFMVTIPVQKSSSKDESDQPLKKQIDESCLNKEFQGLTALVIDDDVFNLKIMRLFFQKMGIETLMAGNGEEGFRIFKSSPKGSISFITTDLQMPVTDGYTCGTQIRRFEKIHHYLPTPIIVITGNIAENEKARCLDPNEELKATLVLRKPINMADCYNFVTGVVKGNNPNPPRKNGRSVGSAPIYLG